VESGTHETLFAKGGRYHELYTKQHGLSQNLFLAPGEGEAKETAGEAGAPPVPESPDLLRLLRNRSG
jgi:hypothetical protein